LRSAAEEAIAAMTQPHHPLYIVASPRPRVGKTLLARLLIEFFYASDRALIGYDLNAREPGLAGRFPHLVWPVDITETLGQMELFDRLIADNSRTQIVDIHRRPIVIPAKAGIQRRSFQ
jgi:hypothetical protein